jgi:hypothetical protein
MQDAAHMLERLRERRARPLLADPTTELTKPRDVPPAPSPAPTAEPDRAAPRERRRRHGPGALVVAVLAGLLAVAAVVGFLLLQGKPAGTTSTQGPTGTPRTTHHSATSGASTPTTSPPTTTPTTTRPVAGGSAQQFVRSYYAALPSDTRTAWAALSPGFQDRIGGYGSYQGFWSTISRVSTDRTRPAGRRAVDVSLTYTRNDGGTESEVRRLFLERHGSGYLVTGDQVVG